MRLLPVSIVATVPACGAAAASETVHWTDAPAVTTVVLQPSVNEEDATCNCWLRLTPLRLAVTVALPPDAPALAVKLALAEPALTVTEAGTVMIGGFDDRVTVNAVVAALVSVTVHVEVPPGFSEVGVQLRAERAAGAVRPNENVREPPFRLAVSVAEVSIETRAAVAVNIAVVDPAFTVTVPGTVADALLLESATLAPPVGAAALSVTVQLLVPGVLTEPGVQLKLAG